MAKTTEAALRPYAAQPLIIHIEKTTHGWHEDLDPADKKEMARREAENAAGDEKKRYSKKWTDRTKGKKKQPRYKEVHGHEPFPVTVRCPYEALPAERVRFECVQPFLVVISPEPEVTSAGPASPFEDTDPRVPFSALSRPDGAGKHFVERTVRAEAYQQLFYKMFFIVFDADQENAQFVDPDFFSDL